MLPFGASLVILATLIPWVTPSPQPVIPAAVPASTSTAKLNTLAQSIGKLYFGSAVDNNDLPNATYVSIFDDSTMFGQTTATNSMKWVRDELGSMDIADAQLLLTLP